MSYFFYVFYKFVFISLDVKLICLTVSLFVGKVVRALKMQNSKILLITISYEFKFVPRLNYYRIFLKISRCSIG